MPAPTHADIEHLVTATVSERLQLAAAAVTSSTDLRTFSAFSSFVAVDILEKLESALQVEIPADLLRAERLCSVAALTDLFGQALAGRAAVAS